MILLFVDQSRKGEFAYLSSVRQRCMESVSKLTIRKRRFVDQEPRSEDSLSLHRREVMNN